ncbi:DUF2855 family protein [Nocardioides speluncae]|uniref:DUF2855 family protein n=1 Tax=Nocardioides speluncae TaxID=2670337 RepID=UPI00137A2190|nr:DUF2855 family protein [Nocardioides speluncae]
MVRRDDWAECETRAGEPGGELAPGEARFRIERLALTSNNVTYALIGEQIGYWRFFPAADGWGRVPAWGYAEVVDSAADAVEVGERFYGFWPMSSEVTLEPVARGRTVVDSAAHRRELPGLYNTYLPAAAPDTETEELLSLVRPLFTTAWLLDDYLALEGFRGAATVLVSSASSKTAAAMAWCLAQRSERPHVVGLTSAGNKEYVAGLGTYDEAVAYDDIASADVAGPVVLVDFAGRPGLRTAIGDRFGPEFRWLIGVGITHAAGAAELSGGAAAESEFFFAPTYLERRTAELGAAELRGRIGAAESAYVDAVARSWPIQRVAGPDAVRQAWLDQVAGHADPRGGVVLTFAQEPLE